MNVEKLKKMAGSVRTGGKGSMRRKKKAVHKTTITDDKMESTLIKIGAKTILDIEEVNIYKEDVVIQFHFPDVAASISANTWVVTGNPQTKKLKDLPPEIINQLSISLLEEATKEKKESSKKKAVKITATRDDIRLQRTLKRIGVNEIPGVEEVNIFKDDEVIRLQKPRVQASIADNTWVVSGAPQAKTLSRCCPSCLFKKNDELLDLIEEDTKAGQLLHNADRFKQVRDNIDAIAQSLCEMGIPMDQLPPSRHAINEELLAAVLPSNSPAQSSSDGSKRSR